MSEPSPEAVSVRRMMDTHAQQTQYTDRSEAGSYWVWRCFLPPISGLMNLRISELAIGMGEEEGMEESFVHS